MIVFLLSLVFAVILESTLTTLPLTLLMILFLAITRKSNDVFLFAFFAGFFLDILSFGLIGLSSLYFVVLVFIVFQYQKRFEIETMNFLALFSFLGSLIYLLIDGARFAFFQSLVATFIIISSYFVFRRFNKKSRLPEEQVSSYT